MADLHALAGEVSWNEYFCSGYRFPLLQDGKTDRTTLRQSDVMARATNKRESRVNKEIADLSRLGVSISGTVYEESEDHVSIQVGRTLYEIPRNYITNTTETSQEGGNRVVTLELSDDARLIQKTLVSAADLAIISSYEPTYDYDKCRRCPMCVDMDIIRGPRVIPAFRRIIR